jgi:hypothetical protein
MQNDLEEYNQKLINNEELTETDKKLMDLI